MNFKETLNEQLAETVDTYVKYVKIDTGSTVSRLNKDL
jgi:hypothetical protein